MTRIGMSVKNLKEITDLLNTVITEVKLKLETKGVNIRAVDPAHVAMINIDVPKESFREYVLDGEEEIAIDVERLKNVIKVARDSDEISITKEKDKLLFEIGTVNKKFNLLDPSTVTTPKIPQISSEFYVIILKSDLEKGLKAAEDVSDAIRLTLTPDSFRARSVSDTEESELILPKDMLKEISCKSTIKSSYPLEYLIRFIKSVTTTDELKLSFKDDYPLVISFKFGVGRDIDGTFLLAPRMEQ
jgi:proliferating cell nuclear antigen